MAIEKYNDLTGIKNVQIGDYDWIENLFAEYVVPGSTGFTEGLLNSLQLFYTLYLNDPRNLYSGLNISGGTDDVYKVKYDASDLEGYLGDKIKTDALSGIILDVDGTTNKVMKISLQLNESDSTSAFSILQDSKTLKKFTEGTGINIISTTDELSIGIDEAFLEGLTYGIKYAWADEAEMLAETGMADGDLGVRNDLAEVWKYNESITTWEYFFDLGTSTTDKTTVSSVPTESYSGSQTTQQGINEENVSELDNIYNILEGNSPAFGDLIGDPLPQDVPDTETVATWSTVNQSSNTDTWEFNDTNNEILIKKAGFYTWNTQIELVNSSSQTRFLVFSTRNKNDNSEVFYTREITVSRDGVNTQSSITFEVPDDDTTMEITIHGHTAGGQPNDDLTIVAWNTSLLLNFILNPNGGGGGEFPLQWEYEDFEGVDGKFNIQNAGIAISKNMFSNEAKTTFVDMSSILSDLTAGNSMVLVDEQGNKALFTFNVDFTDEGTYFYCDDYTETGVFTHNIGEDYNFQFIGLASSGGSGSGQFPFEYQQAEYAGIETVTNTGEFYSYGDSILVFNKTMWADEDKTSTVYMEPLLELIQVGDTIVSTTENGDKVLYEVTGTDGTDSNQWIFDVNFTGLPSTVEGESCYFQVVSSASGQSGSELSGVSVYSTEDGGFIQTDIYNMDVDPLVGWSDWYDVNYSTPTTKIIGSDLTYTANTITNNSSEDKEVEVEFDSIIWASDTDDGVGVFPNYWLEVGMVSSLGNTVVSAVNSGEIVSPTLDARDYSGKVNYTLSAGETISFQARAKYIEAYLFIRLLSNSFSVTEIGNSVSGGTSDTRFLSTYEAFYDGTGFPVVPTTNGEVRWSFNMGNVIFNIFKDNIDGETVYNLSNITIGDLVSLWVLDNPTSRVFEVDGFTDNGTYWTITGQNKTNSGTFVDGDKIVIEFEPSGGGTDENVKISDTDTTAGKLIDKISAGSNVTITTVDENGDEKLLITSSGEVSSIVKQGVNYYNIGSDICNNVGGVGQEIVNITSVNSNGTGWLVKSPNGNVLTDIPTVANITFADGLSPAIPILDNTKAIQMKLRTGNCRVRDLNRNDKTGIAYVEINIFELDSQSIVSQNHSLIQTVQLMDSFGANNSSVIGSGQTSNSYVTFELTNLNGIFTLDSSKQYGFTISGTNDQNPPKSVEKIMLMDTAILTVIYEGEVL